MQPETAALESNDMDSSTKPPTPRRPTMASKPKRNRAQTCQRVLRAVRVLIARQGLEKITIHQISEQADVSKVLIYRYFGSLEGLLKAFIESCSHPKQMEPDDTLLSPGWKKWERATGWASITCQLYRELRASKAARVLLRESLIRDDELAATMAQAQDAELTQFVAGLSGKEALAGGDASAVLSILLGGLSYLTILAHQDRPMLGIDLRSEEGWHRIESAIKVLYTSLDTTRSNPDHKKAPPLFNPEW